MFNKLLLLLCRKTIVYLIHNLFSFFIRDIGRAIITDAVPEFQVPSYSIAVARAIVFTKFEEETWRERPEFKNTVGT